ncbi:MAG: SIS domain-containing protein [Armatimonadetes bacterium]|nr:SIS domain-containing protein [Armatimonadota bacterium]
MESEIREQPDVLARNEARYLQVLADRLAGREFGHVLLVARGSSDNAALYLRYLIEVYLKIPVSLAAPSVLTMYGSKVKYRNCLGVGISQSGQAPDVIAVLKVLSEVGHFNAAFTNDADSPLAVLVDLHLDLRVGPERSIAATKTYSASLLACYQLVRALGAKLPPPVLPDDGWLELCRVAAEKSVDSLLNSSVVFALGRGFSFASAQETALKLIECALVPCKSYSSADFQHGPRAVADDDASAIVYGEVPENLAETGIRIIQAPDAGYGSDAPIREALFAQQLALAAARKRGLDPDQARNLEKITKTL